MEEKASSGGTSKRASLRAEDEHITTDYNSGYASQGRDYPCTKTIECTVEPPVDPKEFSMVVLEVENVCYEPPVTSTGVKINWNFPVYLQHGRRLHCLRRPQLRLFCLAQVRRVLEQGQFLLASIMLTVLGTEGQCRSQDSRRCVEYWRLRMQLGDLPPEQIIQEASRSISGTSLDQLLSLSTQSTVMLPATLTPSSSKRKETPLDSPPTPELKSAISLLSPRTPELDDEETQRMRAEIDDVIQRTPAIQDTPCKRPPTRLLEKALTAIKETSLFGRDHHRHRAGGKSTEGINKLEGGSAYLYAMITPSKRLRGLLETNVAVSPVRRSKRLLERGNTPKGDIYEKIDDIPDMSSIGYIPNSHVDALMHPRKKLFKVDDNDFGNKDDDGEDDGQLDRDSEQQKCKDSENNM